jgi:tetratricopeptide (TPR) repeat protein
MNSWPKNLMTIMSVGLALSACRTLETGAKVVDKDRGEVLISSAGDQRSAMPEGSKDTSITKARQRLETMVRENPKDTQALLGLAQLQLAQDRYSDAEETSRKVLLLDIKNQDARKVLAQVAIRRGNNDMALIFLTALGGEQSKDSGVHNMLGLIALSRGDNGEAMRLWKQALSINSGDISVRMNMGVLYLKNRLLAQASTQFERVLKSAPNHQDARLHLAIIEASRGKNAEAIDTYKSILAGDRDNQLALFNLGVAQKNMTQYDDAVASLKKYIKASPEKSNQTDQAFAMIDEINTIKSAQGQKVSDDELLSLAKELSTRKPTGAVDKSSGFAQNEQAAKPAQAAQPVKASTDKLKEAQKDNTKSVAAKDKVAAPASKPEEPTVSDSEIEALERQLKAPAH